MHFEYMVMTMLCYESLYGECALLACWPANKMYKKMLRIMK